MTQQCLHIDFVRAAQPVTGLQTKFGGSPVWLQASQWPLSRATGQPMMFIGQIALAQTELFAGAVAQMAYVFIGQELVEKTWDPDAGENAVILQPGHCDVPHRELSSGPTISSYDPLTGTVGEEPAEFSVTLSLRSEPDYIPQSQRLLWSGDEAMQYWSQLQGNKIGGSPVWIYDDRLPFEKWRLLLQLHSLRTPFEVNFGADGTGYVIANSDCTHAKFFWRRG